MQPETTNSIDMTKLNYGEILKANGITHEVSEAILKDSLLGEGYLSQQRYITVTFKDPNIRPLNLFAKTHTANASHSEMVDDLKAFEKETRFFVEYIPAARELCKSKGQEELLDIYPKCYYGDDNLVIFENLVVDKGYILLRKEEMQDLEAATCAIKTLAKHHAISHAMIKKHGGPKKFFQKFKNLDYESFTATTFEKMNISCLEDNLKTNILLLETNVIEGRDEALAKSKLFLDGKAYQLILKTMESLTDDEFAVLNHGDYWNNNMMFKRDAETNEIVGHIAIDFQVTRYNSPTLDLSYFLYTSVKTDIRRAHLQTLLTLYLETLQKTCKDLEHPIDLTYDELFLAYRKKISYGFFFGILFGAGAAMQVLEGFDMNQVGDMSNLLTILNKLIRELSFWCSYNARI